MTSRFWDTSSGRIQRTGHKTDLVLFITPTIVQDEDYQPTKTDYLKTPVPKKDSLEGDWSAWDSGKPKDWSKQAAKPELPGPGHHGQIASGISTNAALLSRAAFLLAGGSADRLLSRLWPGHLIPARPKHGQVAGLWDSTELSRESAGVSGTGERYPYSLASDPLAIR